MKIRTSGSNGAVRSKNSHVVSSAQSILNAVIPIAQEQADNSLKVDGHPILIYNRLSSGIQCSCSHGVDVSPTAAHFDESGNASPEFIQTVLQEASYGIIDYEAPSVYNPDPGSRYVTENSVDVGDSLQENVIVDASDTVELQSPLNELYGGGCPICYGSGYVGGYSLYGGSRYVLDYHNALSLDGVELRRTCSPYALHFITNPSSITFNLTLPRGATRVDVIRVMNETDVTKLRVQVRDTNGFWVALTSTNLLTFCTGKPVQIRVVGGLDDIFTHIEIQLGCTELAYTQYPRLQKGFDPRRVNPVDPVSLMLSGRLPRLEPWDVIYDTVWDLMWVVQSVNNFQDSKLNVLGWDVQARVCEPYEHLTFLPRRPSNRRALQQSLSRPHIGSL